MAQSSELLVVIVDANSRSWNQVDRTNGFMNSPDAHGHKYSTFPEFLSCLEAFLSAFVALDKKNSLFVYGYNNLEGGRVYPPNNVEYHDEGESSSPMQELSPDGLRSSLVRKFVHSGLMQLRYEKVGVGQMRGSERKLMFSFSNNSSNLASIVSNALLLINKLRSPNKLRSSTSNDELSMTRLSSTRCRILTFQLSGDNPYLYTPMINCIYTAQRHGVIMDSCLLDLHSSVFLQQAAHITGGQYLHPDAKTHSGFLQFLLMHFLHDRVVRQYFLTPPRHSTNLRAHCFCHKRHVDVGWLCTVCLSIWCEFSEQCAMCKTSSVNSI